MINRSSGFSLVETLVAIAIMAAISLAMLSMLETQQKQLRVIKQMQELADVKNIMLIQLSKPNVCYFHLQNRDINVSGNPTETKPSSTVIQLSELRQSGAATAPILAKAGQQLSGTSGINVSTISFRGIHSTGTPDEFRGYFEIVPDPKSLQMPLKPIQIQQIVTTDPGDPPGNKTIIGCGQPAVSSSGQIVPGWPNMLNCGGTVWTVFRAGVYHCFRGGESTTRSAIATWASTSSVGFSCKSSGSGCGCPSGSCRTMTIDQLIQSGQAN